MTQASCHPAKQMQAKGLCKNCYDKMLKKRNPEYQARQNANNRAWVQANKERMSEYRRQWQRLAQLNGARKGRRAKLASFGMTFEDEAIMLVKQGGVCAICRGFPSREFDIDHDHTTGVVRGLLCGRCNKGLGLLGDDVNGLYAALKYLQQTLTFDSPPSTL